MHGAPAKAELTDELNDELTRFVRLLKAAAPTEAGQDRSALQLLSPLMHEGSMRLRDLAEAKGSDASTVSRQVAQLVRAGLIRRDPDPGDGRACRLALTEGGRGVCERMIDARRRAIAEALREWDADRIRDFTRMFRDFNRAVEAHRDRMQELRHAPSPAVATETTTLAAAS
jgi:DNA-binding MarR family transcriptional regulator